jgi:biopolymer transport protein ExbD
MRLGRPPVRTKFVIPRLSLIARIDVVLFLLLYFMIAGSLNPEESALVAALKTESRGSGRGSDLQAQILFVEAPAPEGKTRFRIGERVAMDKAGLAGVLGLLPKEGGVVVRVGGEVQVEAAAAALQACRDAGFTKISYVPGR